MDKIQRVRNQLLQKHPVFSPPFISDVSEICEISYNKVLAFIGTCKVSGKDVHLSLHEFIRGHRPDLIAFQNNNHEQLDIRANQGA